MVYELYRNLLQKEKKNQMGILELKTIFDIKNYLDGFSRILVKTEDRIHALENKSTKISQLESTDRKKNKEQNKT